jgi:hypothetical protein
MELQNMRFFRAEQDINFTVFCDVPCRVKYLESIPLPMSASPMEVYAIEPGLKTQWIAVQRREEEDCQMQFFMRDGSVFEERPLHLFPEQFRFDMEKRIGHLELVFANAA